MGILEDMDKLIKVLRDEPYHPERAVVGPEFQGLVDGWAIETACEGMKTWLSLHDRARW